MQLLPGSFKSSEGKKSQKSNIIPGAFCNKHKLMYHAIWFQHPRLAVFGAFHQRKQLLLLYAFTYIHESILS